MSVDAAATNRQYFVADTLGCSGGGCVPDITDLYYWFLANRRHLVCLTWFSFDSFTSSRPLDCHWIELWQVSLLHTLFLPSKCSIFIKLVFEIEFFYRRIFWWISDTLTHIRFICSRNFIQTFSIKFRKLFYIYSTSKYKNDIFQSHIVEKYYLSFVHFRLCQILILFNRVRDTIRCYVKRTIIMKLK